MARYIDADAALNKLPDDLPYKASVKRVLMSAPAVDAVEVVRCKDCEYYTTEKNRCDHPKFDYEGHCYDYWIDTKPDDFCSYGIPKERGDE